MFLQHTGLGYAKVQVWALEGLPQLEKPQTHIKKTKQAYDKSFDLSFACCPFFSNEGGSSFPQPAAHLHTRRQPLSGARGACRASGPSSPGALGRRGKHRRLSPLVTGSSGGSGGSRRPGEAWQPAGQRGGPAGAGAALAPTFRSPPLRLGDSVSDALPQIPAPPPGKSRGRRRRPVPPPGGPSAPRSPGPGLTSSFSPPELGSG